MIVSHLISIVSRSAIYVPADSEGIRINYWQTEDDLVGDMGTDELCFYGTGEESGEEYMIPYSEINLAEDMFYELKLVDIASL